MATLLAEGKAGLRDGLKTIFWESHVGDFPTWLKRADREERASAAGAVLPHPHPLPLGEGRGERERVLNSDVDGVPAPHAILFDAFSPAKNAAMWTLPLFTSLFRHLDPARPCAMPTYSRATLLRVTWLLAGFHVGVGHATGEKEETTLAANTLALLDEPLDRKWLERARRSTSAEPLHEPKYRQAPLTAETWERLQTHPQFQ